MNIDRSSFLLLTASLAGAACGPEATQPTRTAVPISGYAEPAPPPTNEPLAFVDAAAPIAPHVETPPAPHMEGGTDLGEDRSCFVTSKAFDATRRSCNDQPGAPVCTGLRGFPSAEGCDLAEVKTRCDLVKGALKPKVAAATIACMARNNRDCDFCKLNACAYDALMSACPDDTSDADCRSVAQTCTKVDLSRCKAWLSGMTAQGRAKMLSCIKDDCGSGFAGCFGELE